MTTYFLDLENGVDFTRDVSPTPKEVTRLPAGTLTSTGQATGGAGTPLVTTAQKKFGLGSLDLSNTTLSPSYQGNSNLSTPAHADFNFGTGQFTIEAWVMFTVYNQFNAQAIVSNFTSAGTYGFDLAWGASNFLSFNYSKDGTTQVNLKGSVTPVNNQWYHVAVDRDASGVIRVYKDGVVVASATDAGSIFASPNRLHIGNNANQNVKFPGYIGGLRITKGVARYAGAFTPPTANWGTNSGTDPYYANCGLILDFNDIRDGLTFDTRWKTPYNAHYRMVAGDTLKVMATPDETLVGNATWTNNNKRVVLDTPVTTVVESCEIAWTPAANITSTVVTSNVRQGNNRLNLVLATAFNTGLVAYAQIPETPVAAPTNTNRASNLLGAGTLTLLQNATADDAQLAITLPFNIVVSGVTTNKVYVVSNNWVAFGTSPANNLYSPTGSNPSFPNIQMGVKDCSYQRVYAGTEDGGATYRIRYEGNTATTGTVGSPTIVWEMTFSAANPTQIKIDFGANGNSALTTKGVSDGASYVATFGSGVVNTGYDLTYSASTPLDLSAYQQLSFWFAGTNQNIGIQSFTLKLCSDVAGQVPLVSLPFTHLSTSWQAFALDNGAPLPSAVKSIALYCDADVTPSGTTAVWLDHIIACKAPSAPDALTLNSLIGKVSNKSWTATTAYAGGAVRRPTQVNRNGFVYQVTTAGTTGATEPAWPGEYGLTVTDGTVVWTCYGQEDTWYPIQSIVGTSVTLDTSINANASQTFGTYQGDTENIATYKRETLKLQLQSGTPIWMCRFPDMYARAGSAAAGNTVYSGGWNRTDMSTKTAETWLGATQGIGYFMYSYNLDSLITFDNFGLARFEVGFYMNAGGNLTIKNCQMVGMATAGITEGGQLDKTTMFNLVANNNNTGIEVVTSSVDAKMIVANGNNSYGFRASSKPFNRIVYLVAKGNNYGAAVYNPSYVSCCDTIFSFLKTANNVTSIEMVYVSVGLGFLNAQIAESTFTSPPQVGYVWFQNYQNTPGNHMQLWAQGVIRTVTDVRHTASGLAWRFSPTVIPAPGTGNWNFNTETVPMRLSVAKVFCAAGQLKTVQLWTRRDGTTVRGRLFVRGGQIAGVPNDVYVDCQPAVNTWVQSSALSFTPTEDGVVDVEFLVWDGINTNQNFWIDDISIS